MPRRNEATALWDRRSRLALAEQTNVERRRVARQRSCYWDLEQQEDGREDLDPVFISKLPDGAPGSMVSMRDCRGDIG